MKQIECMGYILARHNLGENDRIYSLFSQDDGKVSFVAKGIKKSSAKLSGQLQPFACIKLRLIKGKNLDILVGAQIAKHYDLLSVSMEAIGVGYRMIEMIARCLAENQPSLPAFKLFEQCCQALMDGINPQLVNQYFSVRFLDIMGSQPDFEHVNPTPQYYLDYDSGHIVANRPSAHYGIVPEKVIKLWRLVLHKDLKTLSRISNLEDILHTANMLIEKHYEFHYNVRFKSKQII
jgi:DNA repair protein RecO (recombination protein O)